MFTQTTEMLKSADVEKYYLVAIDGRIWVRTRNDTKGSKYGDGTLIDLDNDKKPRFWLYRNDVFFSIYDVENHKQISVNSEDESLKELAEVWEFLTGKIWAYERYEEF